MSRKNKSSRPPGASPVPKATGATSAHHTNDSFANFQARLGWGADNQSSGSQYTLSYQSRNRIWLEAAYRGSWIVGKAVDAVAEDMTRAGIEMRGMDPGDINLMDRSLTRLGIWDALCDTGKWARLYGGAIAVMLIDGQDMSTPLRPDAVGKGAFKGLAVLDRWMVAPPAGEVVTEFGPDMGKPKFYTVLPTNTGLPPGRIHYSRVVRLDGVDLPFNQRISENGWGLSVLEPMWDRLIAFDSASVGIGQLIYKAHLRVISIEKLREIIAMGGVALAGLKAQIDFIREAQTNEGITLLDSTDKFETHQYSFSGLSDVLLRFAEQLAGSIGTPLTRLFGQSPGGLGSTGEGEMKQYHENVKQQQERRLRNPLHRLLATLSMSVLGKPLPDDFDFDFRNLQDMSETEKADISTKKVQAVTGAFDADLIDKPTAMRELKASAPVMGMFGGISDEAIAEAEELIGAPLPPGEIDLPDMTKLTGDSGSAFSWIKRFRKNDHHP